MYLKTITTFFPLRESNLQLHKRLPRCQRINIIFSFPVKAKSSHIVLLSFKRRNGYFNGLLSLLSTIYFIAYIIINAGPDVVCLWSTSKYVLYVLKLHNFEYVFTPMCNISCVLSILYISPVYRCCAVTPKSSFFRMLSFFCRQARWSIFILLINLL